MKYSHRLFYSLFCLMTLVSGTQAFADYSDRLSLGVGFDHVRSPSETAFSLGAEYESRFDLYLGVGGMVEHVFSSPGITYLGAPEFFLHPFGSDFLVSATPLLEFGSSVGTHVGGRFGTRLPIPLGVVNLVPLFAVDVISGGPNYTFGLGIEF